MSHAQRTLAAGIACLALACGAAAQATVSCTLSAVGPAFGIYTPTSTSALDSNGNVTVTCTLLSGGTITVMPTVTLSAGASGNFVTRTMLSGTQKLNYNLYWSTAYSQVWGDGTGGSYPGSAKITLSPAAPTQSASGVVYGQVYALQNPAPGSYTDSIVVTATY